MRLAQPHALLVGPTGKETRYGLSGGTPASELLQRAGLKPDSHTVRSASGRVLDSDTIVEPVLEREGSSRLSAMPRLVAG